MTIDLVTATRLVGPSMAKTLLAQIRKKAGSGGSVTAANGEEMPPDEAVYEETVQLMRSMMKLVSMSAVEDLHAITNNHSPAPPSVRVIDVDVPLSFNDRAAELLQRQLGVNLERVGPTWWQWHEPGKEHVKAQWVEMKVDFEERERKGGAGNKVMFYVHGGAYYLGGIGHDNQIQRHARKLKGRCFAPRYRLAPQFPFPCAIQDVVSAYLYLLTLVRGPDHIVIAGDSAGGGLCMALLLICRDQGIPMPAGASLISPWVDLTHSFPSIKLPTNYDYVPSTGFHSKPTIAWPPPNPEERRKLGWKENPLMPPDYEIELDGKPYTITDQVNMYAPNLQLAYPLVSPVHAASLGGFCPCQVIVGGAEILRDEQLYMAHKMADPARFTLSDRIVWLNGEDPTGNTRFPPTDVELLVFDDGPHAAPTLGHIDVAKHEYRAVSQFAAWALASAQNTAIEIEDFCARDPISPPPPSLATPAPGAPLAAAAVVSELEADVPLRQTPAADSSRSPPAAERLYTGLRAGNTLPQIDGTHMRRYRVDRMGRLYELAPAEALGAMQMPAEQVGEVKADALKGWIKYQEDLDVKFAAERKKVFQKRMEHAQKGYMPMPAGEYPPHGALVGRRVIGESNAEVSSGGVGNSMLGKLFKGMEKGGPGAVGRQDTMQEVGSAQRASRLVQPTGSARDPPTTLPPLQETLKAQS